MCLGHFSPDNGKGFKIPYHHRTPATHRNALCPYVVAGQLNHVHAATFFSCLPQNTLLRVSRSFGVYNTSRQRATRVRTQFTHNPKHKHFLGYLRGQFSRWDRKGDWKRGWVTVWRSTESFACAEYTLRSTLRIYSFVRRGKKTWVGDKCPQRWCVLPKQMRSVWVFSIHLNTTRTHKAKETDAERAE